MPANVVGWYLAHVDARVRSGAAGAEVSQGKVAEWCNAVREHHKDITQVQVVEVRVVGMHKETPCEGDA